MKRTYLLARNGPTSRHNSGRSGTFYASTGDVAEVIILGTPWKTGQIEFVVVGWHSQPLPLSI